MGNLVEVAKKGDIEPGHGILVEVEGKEIALFNCDGDYYAIDNECTHVGGPLCEGELEGYTVICPWHGAEFNVKTGEALGPPAKKGVKTYRVQIEGDSIKIEV
ncbi:MAG TPA: non-heme iron oxygenase ferredoxin subunit [Thermodesulfobacteriota bacterium]|jgi:nitrite reductase/ring-hydroxylating ferredoxin subunit|nr:non-heme iron oxygenase ferredoxin subunit [Thermodesulfobacteriota bacterium]